MAHEQLCDALRRLAVTMADGFDIGDVLDDLAESTVRILAAAGAGVSIAAPDGRLEFVTATSSDIDSVEHVQTATQQGPCTTALHSGHVIAVSALDDIEHWPEFRAAAREVGLSSVVVVPLIIRDHRVGSLDVYDRSRRTWSLDDIESVHVLADIATAYIVRAGELAAARDLAEQLQGALDSRIVIEQAKGILAQRHDISIADAFEALRRHARSNNMRVRTLARSVVDGTLDPYQPPEHRPRRDAPPRET